MVTDSMCNECEELAEVERLRAENAELRQRLECVTLDRNALDLGCDELATQLAAAQAREEKLHNYVEHSPWCKCRITLSPTCSCGLDRLLAEPDHAALEAALKGDE